MNKRDVFESERLIYTGISEQDADCLVKWRSNPGVIKYFKNPAPVTAQGHNDWFFNIYTAFPDRFDFIITEKSTGRKIGTVSADMSAPEKNSCEISYMIAEPDFQRRGFAVEAVTAVMNQTRREGIRSYFAEIHRDNIASIKTIEKLGYVLSSRRDDFLTYRKDGE